ncbi:Ger(x)C family spore germination protein [Paenibacillus ginsengarvi]|uniref:Ger(X)C family spore germination protein n=1 Tax=Paenibacillus ginsengarvi TaxID=400777 RepID=A0A3B0CJR6_9BACL|nr:Ger(x)C family spore germination protein [Paenibacillus ginsengarvi]RKN84784.1 Ger(x)C family spore germination protein [Paenibacillus ginsengarvi]
MKRAITLLVTAAMLTAVLSGCWNRRELNDLGILTGTAIDKVGDLYKLSVQIVVPGELAKHGEMGRTTPVTMFTATAPTLLTAFRKLTETSPRKIYGAHIRVLVLSEAIAREGIADVIDLLTRDSEVRTDFYVMIAKGSTAENVLNILTTLEKNPSNKLFQALDTSAKEWAPTTRVTLGQLIEKLITEGINPVLTGVQVIGDPKLGDEIQSVERSEPGAKARLTGLAVMRKDKLVGWLNEEESKGYNYITDQVTSTAGYVSCPGGGMLTLETIRTDTSLKARMEKGKPVIEIRMLDESNIAEANCDIQLNDMEVIRGLEEEQRLKKMELMKAAVRVVKEKYHVDIFGFGQAIYRSDPKAWKRLKPDWESHFDNLKIVYDVKVHIRKIGKTNDALISKVKE